MPAGSAYTITEPSENLPTYYTSNITNGEGTVAAGTAQEVTVTNTYNPAPITVKPDDGNYPFGGVKILTGRNWNGSDKFGFKLEAVTDGAPLPEHQSESNGKRYTNSGDVTGTDGTNEEVMSLGSIADKMRAFGMETIEVKNGHDFAEIFAALDAPHNGKPKAIVAHTVKGKGVSYMENVVFWHGSAPSAEQMKQAMDELK